MVRPDASRMEDVKDTDDVRMCAVVFYIYIIPFLFRGFNGLIALGIFIEHRFNKCDIVHFKG